MAGNEEGMEQAVQGCLFMCAMCCLKWRRLSCVGVFK